MIVCPFILSQTLVSDVVLFSTYVSHFEIAYNDGSVIKIPFDCVCIPNLDILEKRLALIMKAVA